MKPKHLEPKYSEASLNYQYNLITADASLHWMDWNIVLPKFKDLLSFDGYLAIINDRNLPTPWEEGYGSALLNEVEKIAKDKGCKLVHLDTFDFQAKDFYLKLGYEIFGILDNCPSEHKRYYMKKSI